MQDDRSHYPPPVLAEILRDTKAIGFAMASEPLVGSLLRTLAASKPAGRLLELGTGTGVGTAWLLAGMDADARLISIESDSKAASLAQRHLATDHRLQLVIEDAAATLGQLPTESFDLIFADTWAGKYTHLDDALRLLKVGGLYVIDDMLPQPDWPEEHSAKAERLIETLQTRHDLTLTRLNCASGVVIVVRTS